jgi:hypothetical protein
LYFDSHRAEYVGERIFRQWNKITRASAATERTWTDEDEDEEELMTDGIDANPAILHKRKAMKNRRSKKGGRFFTCCWG